MSTHRARKRFGQHFLVDQNMIQKIVKTIHLKPTDHCLEIGPGQGAITRYLLQQVQPLYAVEIDRDLYQALTEQYPTSQLVVFNEDITTFDINREDIPKPLRVVGNLPYNVSTPILFHLMSYHDIIEDMHFMVQKELADRAAARPGSKIYGRLSVMLQLYFDVCHHFDIPPSVFNPPPKVNSSIIQLTPNQRYKAVADVPHFSRVVKQAFTWRRKQLQRIFPSIQADEWAQCHIKPTARPETLTLDNFIEISHLESSRSDFIAS